MIPDSNTLVIQCGSRQIEEDVFTFHRVQEAFYSIVTEEDPMRLLENFGCDFVKAADFVVANLDGYSISYRGKLMDPKCVVLGHLKGCYEMAITLYLEKLGVHALDDEHKGAMVFVKSDYIQEDCVICQLISDYKKRTYEPAALLRELSSLSEANVDDIWDKLSAAEFKQ